MVMVVNGNITVGLMINVTVVLTLAWHFAVYPGMKIMEVVGRGKKLNVSERTLLFKYNLLESTCQLHLLTPACCCIQLPLPL